MLINVFTDLVRSCSLFSVLLFPVFLIISSPRSSLSPLRSPSSTFSFLVRFEILSRLSLCFAPWLLRRGTQFKRLKRHPRVHRTEPNGIPVEFQYKRLMSWAIGRQETREKMSFSSSSSSSFFSSSFVLREMPLEGGGFWASGDSHEDVFCEIFPKHISAILHRSFLWARSAIGRQRFYCMRSAVNFNSRRLAGRGSYYEVQSHNFYLTPNNEWYFEIKLPKHKFKRFKATVVIIIFYYRYCYYDYYY